MILIGLFFLLLVVVFALVIVLTRPSRVEQLVKSRLETSAQRDLERHLEPIDILKSDTYSDVPWLNVLLGKLKPSVRLRKLIADADQNWSVGSVIAGSLLAAVVTLWLTRVLGQSIVVVFVLTALTFFAPYLYLIWKRKRRFAKFNAVLPDAMDLISRALRAGHSLPSAMDMVAQEIAEPVAGEFRRIFEEQNLGLPLREALVNLTERMPLPDVRFMVASMLIQRETGGNLVEVLDKAATLVRERARLMGQIRVHTAQGRLTGWILCLLPIFLFFVISWINPQYMETLTSDPLGRTLLITGSCLMMLGVLVIRKIIDIKV